MRYTYETCDVFTTQRFMGNPLAVFPNADGLSDEQMSLIAREMNYSETTFVFEPKEGHTKNVRIFTPTTEVPFAGHPNIGTAFMLASLGHLGELEANTQIAFEEKAGLVPIDIRTVDGRIYCELEAPQPLSKGSTIEVDTIAETLSISPHQIVTEIHNPQVASVGLPFLMVQVADLKTLQSIEVNVAKLKQIEMGVRHHIHAYVRDGFEIRARMFAPLAGVPEDPATGSANCALVSLLTHLEPGEDLQCEWAITQGVEMGRRSLLFGRTTRQNSEVRTWIAGHCERVFSGSVEI